MNLVTTTGESLTVRLLYPSDREKIEKFYNNLSIETLQSFYYVRYEKDVQEAWDSLFSEGRNNKHHQQLIALSGEKIIAWRMVKRIMFPEPLFDYDIYETGCIVSDEYQGKGVGSILMQAVLEYAKNNWKGTKIRATTKTANKKACTVLEKFGFSKQQYSKTTVVYCKSI